MTLRTLACGLAALGPALALAAAPVDLCTQGRRQSPVDLRGAVVDPRLPPLEVDYHATPVVLVHDGHTVRARIGPGSRLLWGRVPLTLTQIHVHLPGGDRIEGEDFPMALHLLHRHPSGQLVSLVAPFRLGAEHAGLRALLPLLPREGQGEQRPAGARLAPADFVPALHGYYRYEGSLTSAPCTEGVQWLVWKEAQTLSKDQLAALQRLIHRNAREVQPLNGRSVQASSAP